MYEDDYGYGYDDMDATVSRPPLERSRATSPWQHSDQAVSQLEGTGSLRLVSGNTGASRRGGRHLRDDARGSSRANLEDSYQGRRVRTSSGGTRTGRTYTGYDDAGRSDVLEFDDRGRKSPRRERGRHSSRGSHSSGAQHAGGIRVPLGATVILVIVGVVVAVLVTSLVMAPRVRTAESEAREAQQRVTMLSRQLDALAEQLEEAQQDQGDANEGDHGTDLYGIESSVSTTKGVEDPWLKEGKFSTGDTVLDKAVKEFCDGVADTSLSQTDAALAVYKQVAWSDYVERDAAQSPTGADWRQRFARMYADNDNSGNCYEFGAFLMYCLRYLGYEDALAQGILVKLESGDWGDHCVVYVTNTDGSPCLCDTSRGTDGWMLPEDSYSVQIVDLASA